MVKKPLSEFKCYSPPTRESKLQVPTPKQVKREMNESNKDALIASLKRKNQKLEEENKQLREQLKVAYAEVYKKL